MIIEDTVTQNILRLVPWLCNTLARKMYMADKEESLERLNMAQCALPQDQICTKAHDHRSAKDREVIDLDPRGG